jgi:hypothetical protein
VDEDTTLEVVELVDEADEEVWKLDVAEPVADLVDDDPTLETAELDPEPVAEMVEDP